MSKLKKILKEWLSSVYHKIKMKYSKGKQEMN